MLILLVFRPIEDGSDHRRFEPLNRSLHYLTLLALHFFFDQLIAVEMNNRDTLFVFQQGLLSPADHFTLIDLFSGQESVNIWDRTDGAEVRLREHSTALLLLFLVRLLLMNRRRQSIW